MKTRIMFLGLIAVLALSFLTAVYALTENKPARMELGKPRHYNRCPCMMACDPNSIMMCRRMGMSEEMMDRCRMMMHTRMDVNCPEALLAVKSRLALTDEQVSKLNTIAQKSRMESEAVLTAGQKEILKKMTAAPDTMMKMHHEMMPMMKNMEMKEGTMEQKSEETATMTESAKQKLTEQKLCPVTGKPIDKEERYWTMYKGKKVYFCCPMCKPQFDKDPEKYVKILPQFKE